MGKNHAFCPSRAGPGRSPDPAHLNRAAGFTLLEILVVVVIIGLMTAGILMTMNFSGRDSQLQTESERLESLMNYARDQAELQTRNYGIVFSQHGYAFVVYGVRTGAWRQVFEDDALRERTLPGGLDFKLQVDARPIVLNDTITLPTSKESSSPTPHTGPDAGSDSGSSSNSDSSAGAGPDSSSDSDSTAFAPQVMIFSSGDLSSFKITLERPATGRSITLDIDRDGNIVRSKMLESGS